MPIPDFRDVSVAVTGGAGFIGSHLVDALVERGAKVTVLDDLSTGFERNLEQVRDRIRFLKGDIRDPEICRDAVADAQYVFHQAARGSVPRSMSDPVPTIDINVRGTVTVFAACRDAKVQAVVYASSSSVYGDSTTLPKREGEEGKPISPYALSKVMNEQLADVFARCYGMRLVGLRYFNVFGPRQNPDGEYAGVIPRWIRALLRRERCTIHGDGETSRDFCYIANVVQANVLAATIEDKDAVNRVYNIAYGGRTTLNAMHTAIRDGLAAISPSMVDIALLQPVHAELRAGDIRHSQADISKACQLLGYAPTHSAQQGIAETIAWYAAALA